MIKHNDKTNEQKETKKESVETVETQDLASENPDQNQELKNLKQKAEECEAKYKRAIADYQNLQKRSAEEKIDWIRSANKELLLRLLPVLDTLMLAQKHIQNDGLKVSINQFLDTLKAEGVTKIKSNGEKFDPATMECITTEDGDDGKVLEEIRAGYTLNDKLLRPAQVKVGQAKQE